MKKLGWILLAAASVPAFAQESPVLTDIVKHLKLSKEYTLAIANQMPAENYDFKPNPAEMSFGEQMNHIATSNSMFGALLNGAKAQHFSDAKKEAVIRSLETSFDSAIDSASHLKDSDLWTVKKGPEGEQSLFDSLLLMLDHTTHHRAQCIVYLRVKGIQPAEYRF